MNPYKNIHHPFIFLQQQPMQQFTMIAHPVVDCLKLEPPSLDPGIIWHTIVTYLIMDCLELGAIIIGAQSSEQ